MKHMGRVGLQMSNRSKDIDRGKMVSIKFKRINTGGQNEVSIGLTVTIMALIVACRANQKVTMVHKKVMIT